MNSLKLAACLIIFFLICLGDYLLINPTKPDPVSILIYPSFLNTKILTNYWIYHYVFFYVVVFLLTYFVTY